MGKDCHKDAGAQLPFTHSNLAFETTSKPPTMFPVRATEKMFRSLFIGVCLASMGRVMGASAGQVQLLDGRLLEGGLRFNESGALTVQSTQGEPVTVELKKIASATFASGSFFSSGSMLPNGWVATDYGDARGSARLETNTFNLRVEGQSTNATACHFVSRSMLSDGQIYVRVDDVEGNGLTQAGVMIRAHHSSVFAALSLGSDGRIGFQRRADPEKREVRFTSGPKASAPVWFRLQLKEKQLTALYALDGKTWETLISEPFKLGAERTWRESEGDLHLLRGSVGVFASSRGANTLGTARVSKLLLVQNGLVGEYFADRELANLQMARFDPQIRFNWGSGSPDASLPTNHFSVRWTGKLVSKHSASYSFHLDAGDRARLWVDDKETPFANFYTDERATNLHMTYLLAGRPTDIKVEFEKTTNPAAIKLAWALPRQRPEVIDMTNFTYYFTGVRSPESIALARVTNAGPVVRGIILRNGTFLAGSITKADESAVRIAFAGRKDAPILNNRIARLVLRPPRQALPYDIAQDRTGVFIKSGDFFECDFRSVERNTLTVSSVLFGLKRFGIEDSGPLVVVMNDVVNEKSGYEVRLLDGSVLRATNVRATPTSLTATDSILGDLTFPVTELVEVRQLGVTIADLSNTP
jgi:hypothetical protein